MTHSQCSLSVWWTQGARRAILARHVSTEPGRHLCVSAFITAECWHMLLTQRGISQECLPLSISTCSWAKTQTFKVASQHEAHTRYWSTLKQAKVLIIFWAWQQCCCFIWDCFLCSCGADGSPPTPSQCTPAGCRLIPELLYRPGLYSRYQ